MHGLLPVFVLDDYPGYRVARVQDCSRAELEGWVEDNASRSGRGAAQTSCSSTTSCSAGRSERERLALRREGARLELEYSMRGNEELSRWGADVLAGAQATLVGSEHIRDVVAEICGTVDRVHTIPPGVDIEFWRPQPRDEALAALLAESRDDPPTPRAVTSGCPTGATPNGLPRSWPETGRPSSSTGS